MDIHLQEPFLELTNLSIEEIGELHDDLAPGAFLHLITPEDDADDGASNASFIADVRRKLGLPVDAPWADVQSALQAAGYREIRVVGQDTSNHFYLTELEMDGVPLLDKYLR